MSNPLAKAIQIAVMKAGGRASLANKLGVVESAIDALQRNGVAYNLLLGLRLTSYLIPAFDRRLEDVLGKPEIIESALEDYARNNN